MDKKTSSHSKIDRFKMKEAVRSKKNGQSMRRYWTVGVAVSAFFITVLLSFAASKIFEDVHVIWSFLILLFFIAINIIFDIVGTAATAADQSVFNSMASRKVRGSKGAITLVKNADKVSNICCDVVGDIAAIFIGTTTAAISAMFIPIGGIYAVAGPVVLTALSAALTIGGKAAGKNLAVYNSNRVIYAVSWLLSGFF